MVRLLCLTPVLLALACVKPASRENTTVSQPTLHSVRVAPRQPVDGKPPLLVLLHGVGTDEQDLLPLASQFDPRFVVRSVRAPLPMGPRSNAWFHFEITPEGGRRIDPAQAEASRRKLLQFLDEIVAAEGADPERVYLAGFSQGGIMAYSVALTEPKRVAGIVAMSARVLPQVQQNLAEAKSLEGLPILIVHGTQDPVIPVSEGRASKALLADLPIKLTYREFPMGHTISPDSLEEVDRWLRARLDEAR